jgi:methylglutaconyl-CoA hydratase
MPYPTCIELEQEGPVLYVWLSRPEVRNAFNPELISALTQCFSGPALDPGVRVIVLGGNGPAFCAGADLAWMRSAVLLSAEQNYADAQNLAAMLATLEACPCPVVCRVQRAAMGGALGIMACCDTVICTSDAKFAFSEVRVGISPATIAPYIVAKIGISNARDLFLSGERFTADRAFSMGLVHAIVHADELDEVVEAKVDELLMAGPAAVRATKALLSSMRPAVTAELREQTSRLIAELRIAPEGQEGLAAFMEQRPPAWQV